MREVQFRITTEYIKKNINLAETIGQLGDNLFLVSHQKPQNYHYHGYLQIHTTVKTFRSKLSDIIDHTIKPPKGMRILYIKENIDNVDKYKAYCLYRGGHPIESIVVNEDTEYLKSLHEENTKQSSEKPSLERLKLETDFDEIITEFNTDVEYPIDEIIKIIGKFYKRKRRVLHFANMNRLAYTIHSHLTDDFGWLVDKLMWDDPQLQKCRTTTQLESDKKQQMNRGNIDYPY